MPKVIVNHFLADKLGVQEFSVPVITIKANNVQQLIAGLEAKYPQLTGTMNTGVAIAIDDEIFQDALFETLADASEVYFLPAIEGG